MQNVLVHHALSCPNGGLVIARHNEIHDEIIHLARQNFSPNCARGEHLIHLGRSISEEEVHHGGSVPETRVDVSIWGLWESQTEAIIDVRFRNADTDSRNPVIMDKLLAGWEKLKKYKHGQDCYNQRRHFSLFVLSVDGMMGKEALVVLATLSQVMTAKTDEPILHVTGWVNGLIAVAVVG